MKVSRAGRKGWLSSVVVPWFLWVTVVALGTIALAWNQHAAELSWMNRWNLRVVLARDFSETDVHRSFDLQRAQATRYLSAASTNELEFQRVTQGLGYEAAVLLDGDGRLLQVDPPRPELLGTQIASRYAHLQRALEGIPNASNAVASAAESKPIVAFAVPFDTPSGRRVLSGGFSLDNAPLNDYLRNAIPVAGTQLIVLDQAGVILASNSEPSAGTTGLVQQSGPFADALGKRTSGTYQEDGETVRYTSVPISGTPWRLAAATPIKNIYAPIGDVGRWVPRLLLMTIAAIGLAIVLLYRRHNLQLQYRRKISAELSQHQAIRNAIEATLRPMGNGLLLTQNGRIEHTAGWLPDTGGTSLRSLHIDSLLPIGTFSPVPPLEPFTLTAPDDTVDSNVVTCFGHAVETASDMTVWLLRDDTAQSRQRREHDRLSKEHDAVLPELAELRLDQANCVGLLQHVVGAAASDARTTLERWQSIHETPRNHGPMAHLQRQMLAIEVLCKNVATLMDRQDVDSPGSTSSIPPAFQRLSERLGRSRPACVIGVVAPAPVALADSVLDHLLLNLVLHTGGSTQNAIHLSALDLGPEVEVRVKQLIDSDVDHLEPGWRESAVWLQKDNSLDLTAMAEQAMLLHGVNGWSRVDHDTVTDIRVRLAKWKPSDD